MTIKALLMLFKNENLVIIFNPYSLNLHVGKQHLSKFHRWAIKLSIYEYCCIHFPGERILWNDLITGWSNFLC